MRKCNTCGIEKPLTEFHRANNCRDGRHYKCIVCWKQVNTDIKIKVMNHYGGKCACCGEYRIEFLSIDHVNGRVDSNGVRDSKGSSALYRWLKNNKYPEGFRVLCFNCNLSRGHLGYCPHERESEIEQQVRQITSSRESDKSLAVAVRSQEIQ